MMQGAGFGEKQCTTKARNIVRIERSANPTIAQIVVILAELYPARI